MRKMLNHPLMHNNITRDDLDVLIRFLGNNPVLTQASEVEGLEEEWSNWLGVRYSVFVNSGSSANFATMAVLRHLYGTGEVIVPALTWVSDIASVLQSGFTAVFADINPRTLCMDNEQVVEKLSERTKAVFMTYAQGFNGVTEVLLTELKKRKIPLIEDVCEAHGATFKGVKLGSLGAISNFSFYYAHHMSTVEGGMICTDDEEIYNLLRMYRSHGMVREAKSDELKARFATEHPDLNPDFIFAVPGYNMRNTEIGAVIGRNQLNRLDANNEKRRSNFTLFLDNLDPRKYRTDFELEGSCNYAFNLILNKADPALRDRLEEVMRGNGVEYRRGSAGGGNQMRQPYLQEVVKQGEWEQYPETEHIHFYGYYIGNYPALEEHQILDLCRLLNSV
jgi:CDP-4-dehydro-6-deoxyglucose reductase, E1